MGRMGVWGGREPGAEGSFHITTKKQSKVGSRHKKPRRTSRIFLLARSATLPSAHPRSPPYERSDPASAAFPTTSSRPRSQPDYSPATCQHRPGGDQGDSAARFSFDQAAKELELADEIGNLCQLNEMDPNAKPYLLPSKSRGVSTTPCCGTVRGGSFSRSGQVILLPGPVRAFLQRRAEDKGGGVRVGDKKTATFWMGS